MNTKLALAPICLAAAAVAYVAFHPGVAYAAPRVMTLGRPTSMAGKATYTVDPQHTSVYFEINHLGISMVHGRFNKMSGKVVEDSDAPLKSSVEFTAQIDSIDTAVAMRDEHLKSADFFDAAKFPTLTFKSTKLEKVKDGYIVTGDLTMKGKTKTIQIPFKHYGPKSIAGMPDQPARIGVVAEPIVLKRSDFGLGSVEPLPDGTMGVSDEVTVRISLEGTLDK